MLAVLAFESLLVQGAGGSAVPQVDLAEVRRSPVKEPSYAWKKQKYCLLVFGRDAARSTWLVVDGSTMYIDANGNGDLTDPGESVPGNGMAFDANDLEVGNDRLISVLVNLWPDHDLVSVRSEKKNLNSMMRMAAEDANGKLKFSERWTDAPVIWFDGPLEMAPRIAQELHRDDRRPWFTAMIGTPGLGPGTFAAINHSSVPVDVHPLVELSGANGDRECTKFFLEERC